MTKKEKALDCLEKCIDELYDADQLLGGIRTTKETAENLDMIVRKIAEADRLIAVAVDNIS